MSTFSICVKVPPQPPNGCLGWRYICCDEVSVCLCRVILTLLSWVAKAQQGPAIHSRPTPAGGQLWPGECDDHEANDDRDLDDDVCDGNLLRFPASPTGRGPPRAECSRLLSSAPATPFLVKCDDHHDNDDHDNVTIIMTTMIMIMWQSSW